MEAIATGVEATVFCVGAMRLINDRATRVGHRY